MIIDEPREKWFAFATFAFYILGLMFGVNQLVLALLAFLVAGACAFKTIPNNAENKKQQQVKILSLITVLFLTAFAIFWIEYRNNVENEQFKSYLLDHNCNYIGEIVVGATKGGCDQFYNCVDSEEVVDQAFFCTTTKRRITYTDFKAGRYGY